MAIRHKLAAIVCLVAGLACSADLKAVDVTGVGTSRELALKDGLRSAVEKAVGTLITSETAVSNSTLIRDNVLSYSAGYVEDYKVVSEELSLGQVRMNLTVQVSSLKLRQKLDTLNIAVAKLPGQAFSVQIDTKRKAEIDASAMLVPVLNSYPKAAYKIAVKPPRLKKDHGDVADVQLDYTVEFDTAWIRVYESMVAAIANQKIMAPTPKQLIRGNLNKDRGQLVMSVSPIRWNSLEFGFPQVGYVVPLKAYEIAAWRFMQPRRLVLQFYSEDREVVFSEGVNFRSTLRMPQGDDGVTDQAGCNFGVCVGGPMGAWIYTDFKETQSTLIGIPVNILRKIASVECFFDPGDPIEPPSEALGDEKSVASTNRSESFGGVGMRLGMNDAGRVIISSVTPDGPAKIAGFSAGDVVMSIDGHALNGVPDAISKIRGPVGAEVRICVSSQERNLCEILKRTLITTR